MPEEQGTELYTWGQGVLGQLGHGDEKPQNQPRLIVSFLGTNVKAVSCGNQHTAVLLESGEVYCFGRGNFGQLGLGSLQVVLGCAQLPCTPSFAPEQCCSRAYFVTHFLQAANVSNPTVVEGLQGKYITAIACGWHHTAGFMFFRPQTLFCSVRPAPRTVDFVAALTDSGQLYTWGSGEYGRLGHGDENRQNSPKVVEGTGSSWFLHCVLV
jgi:alpha-tubulin suppressor-like RCC1 family protein